jgi:signal transduction histidine kinase
MNHHAVPRMGTTDQNSHGTDSEATAPSPTSAAEGLVGVRTSVACDRSQEANGLPLPGVTGPLRYEAALAELSAKFVNVAANQVESQIESGLRLIVELLGIDRCGLGEVSADGKQLVVTHSYQLPGVPPSERIMVNEQFPTYAKLVYQGVVIRLPDDLPPEAVREREYCLRVGLKSNLTIPLTEMGSVVGGIGFSSFRSRRILPDALIPRLRLLGDVFTNALARKRADEALSAKEQSLRQAKERLRQLAAKLLQAQEEERRRLAREMHDDWTQRLAVLGIDAAKLERHLGAKKAALPLLRAMQEQLVSLTDDVHALSRQLHPSILDDLGLVEALRSECIGFARRERVAVDYRPAEVPANLSKDVALCIYRVAQESLRNIAKHAAAKGASVKLGVSGPELILRIRDEGAGFDPESVLAHPGLGLSSMEERVQLVQGRLTIDSALGQGTTVEVRVPLTGVAP